jgi:hypothetical protein
LATPGDTVYLATPGATPYYGNWTLDTSGTSASQPVTIEPAPGVASPVLDGNNGINGSSAGCQTSVCDNEVLNIESGVYADLQGITFEGANSTFLGGAIYNAGTLTVSGSTFSANTATTVGGAISNAPAGTLTVSTSTFSGNTAADIAGGAIWNTGTLTVSASTFSGNTAGNGDSGDGGAIFNGGTLTVSASTFSGNTASQGAAIWSGGTLTVSTSTFSSNTAGNPEAGDGGAISNGGILSVSASTFVLNWATQGGAIFNGGTLTVSASTFGGNVSNQGAGIDNNGTLAVSASYFEANNGGLGGAIDNNATLTVSASTFAGNYGGEGGAIFNSGDASVSASTFQVNVSNTGGAIWNSGDLSVSASTFSGNTASYDAGAIYGFQNPEGTATTWVAADIFDGPCDNVATWDDEGYNVGSDGSCLAGAPGDVDYNGSLTGVLGPLAANGGPTETMLPLADNPALGLLPNSTTVTLNGNGVTLCPTTDQRGVASVPGQPCNAGAVQPPLPPAAPPAATSSASGTSSSLTGVASATNDETTVDASGYGSLTVSQYSSDPAGSLSFAASGEYFDVEVASGSIFTSVTVTDCNLNGGTGFEWWDPTAGTWEAVSPVPVYDAGTACASATIDSTSSPTLAQLTGTVFGVSVPDSLATTPSLTSASFGTATTLKDSAVLSGGYYPTGTITFTLVGPSGATVDTEAVTVSGNGSYSTPTGYTLPTTNTGTVAGTYQWGATYSGDPNNSAVSENGATSEQVVVSPAGTTLSYTGADQVGVNSSFNVTATLASPAGSCYMGQPVNLSVSPDPLNTAISSLSLGTPASTASGALSLAVSTKSWADGAYMVTASYTGTPNCSPSTNTASLAVTTPGQFAFGGGWYTVAGVGKTSFGFVVAQGPKSTYTGQLSVVTPTKWWFQASVASFGLTSTAQGLLAGTGSLYSWGSALNKGHGGWQLVKSGVTYKATANAATKTTAASFGITIAYTPTSGQPALPNSSPVALSQGGIVIT